MTEDDTIMTAHFSLVDSASNNARIDQARGGDTFPFLELPGEQRNSIYRFLFDDITTPDACFDVWSQHGDIPHYPNLPTFTSLICTCRVVRREARSIFEEEYISQLRFYFSDMKEFREFTDAHVDDLASRAQYLLQPPRSLPVWSQVARIFTAHQYDMMRSSCDAALMFQSMPEVGIPIVETENVTMLICHRRSGVEYHNVIFAAYGITMSSEMVMHMAKTGRQCRGDCCNGLVIVFRGGLRDLPETWRDHSGNTSSSRFAKLERDWAEFVKEPGYVCRAPLEGEQRLCPGCRHRDIDV